jgi:hypothetical protein
VWQSYAPRNAKPRDFWKDISNQRSFFDQLAIKLNIEKASDWYRVTAQEVVNAGGHFISLYYNSSLIKGKEFSK